MDSESVISLSIVFMAGPEKFHNRGFGWICKGCEPVEPAHLPGRSRLMREGEDEGKSPALSSSALARWMNAERTVLGCPICGTTENIDK